MSGIGRVLVAVYGVLALAAIGRSFVQIVSKFDEAPLAYTLSALAAVVYVVATIALVRPGVGWYRVAWATIVFEFTGVHRRRHPQHRRSPSCSRTTRSGRGSAAATCSSRSCCPCSACGGSRRTGPRGPAAPAAASSRGTRREADAA